MEATINSTATRRRMVTLATAIFVIMIIGIAYAAWIADGEGEGYVAAGDVEALVTVVTDPSTTSLLYPDGDADVRLTIQNDNPFNVEVYEINNADTPNIESDSSACDTGEHHVTFADQSASWIVPSNSTLKVELTDAASMGHDSHHDCRGATFTIDVELKGDSTDEAASSDAW